MKELPILSKQARAKTPTSVIGMIEEAVCQQPVPYELLRRVFSLE